jgi:vacuolar-type H+-ATPase subunit F/Vma7
VSRVVAIGSGLELAGYALAGVEVAEADDSEAVRRAWESLDEDVSLLLLTRDAAAALPDRTSRPDLLSVELPE